MIPLFLVTPTDFHKVDAAMLQFMYPIICSLQPLCEDGPPAKSKATLELLMAVRAVECNCGQADCRLTRARDKVYNYIQANLGTTFLLVQCDEIINYDTMYGMAEAINGDPENGIPAMNISDAAYMYQQADLFRRHLIAHKSAGLVPAPPKRKRKNKRGEDI